MTLRTIGSHRERVLTLLARHPSRSFTIKQVARWCSTTERTAVKHLDALITAGHIHELPEGDR